MGGEPIKSDGGRGRLAILHPSGQTALGANPFGKDVANLQLWQALARHAGYARLDVLTMQAADPEAVSKGLLGSSGAATEIVTSLHALSRGHIEAGALLRGHPDLADLAWSRRRRASDRAYSLLGLIHTLAPPAMRQMLAAVSTAPIHPWDVLICTSPSVRDAMREMLEGWEQHLAERTGGRAPPRPMLPVIPLGVDAPAFAAQAARPDARAKTRTALGLADDDALILWVGRLSYFEKAFPQAMFRAAQQAARATGVRTAFVMAGWFPDEFDRGLYQAAARVHAPDVDVHFANGNDAGLVGDLWAGADIFLSLVDNIQETFGITPLEAMASGLPVVVSDWDGYRSTVRDGVEGFLIPTLGGPPGGGLGGALVERHTIDAVTYQAYVGAVAQHTAVHAGRAGAALADLIRAPDLRRRMGQAGQARVRALYDWPVVARQYHDLTDELSELRAAAADPVHRTARDPVKGDPFHAFAGFASEVLTLDSRLRAMPAVTADTVRNAGGEVALDTGFPDFRARPALCADAFALIAEGPDGLTVGEVIAAFPGPQRRGLELGLAWMAKLGFVDWLP